MRELLLLAIVVACCAGAIFKPRFGLLCYLWFALMRPDILAWSNGAYPYSIALLSATLIGTVPQLGQITRIFRNPFTVGLLLLQIPLGLSVVFSLIPSVAYVNYNLLLRIVGTSFLIPMLIRTEKDFRALLMVMSLSLGVIGAKFGLYGLIHGGVRYEGGYGGMLSDNNTMALAFAMAIPLCWGCLYLTTSKLMKWLLLFMMANLVVAIVMTHSRGAAVTLGVLLPLICVCSRRKILAVLSIVLVAGGAVYLVSDSYVQRMETLETYDQDASAEARFELWQAGLKMWSDYPILGVGFGGDSARLMMYKYDPKKTRRQYLHNTFLEYLVGSGIMGFGAYLTLFGGTLIWLQYAAGNAKKIRHGLRIIPRCLQLSLVAFAVGSSFLSRQLFDVFFIIISCTGCWFMIMKEGRLLPNPEAVLEEKADSEDVGDLVAIGSGESA